MFADTQHQGIFRVALPEFKALKDFEWIGYPELKADMVQSVLNSHPNLQSLGLVYEIPFHSCLSCN